jgi:hypothetical protein
MSLHAAQLIADAIRAPLHEVFATRRVAQCDRSALRELQGSGLVEPVRSGIVGWRITDSGASAAFGVLSRAQQQGSGALRRESP